MRFPTFGVVVVVSLMTSSSLSLAPGQTLNIEAAKTFFAYFNKYDDDIKYLLDKIAETPKEPSGLFSKNKSSYEADLDEYLDEALSLLLPDRLINFRPAFRHMDTEIELLRKAKSDIEVERALGLVPPQPDPSRLKNTIRGVLGSGISGLVFGVEVEDIEAQIRELENQREALIYSLRESLENEFGMILKVKHCEALLYQANGEDLLGGIAVARSLSKIEGNIKSVLVKSSDDLVGDVRLKYYRFAVIVRSMIERLTEKHLNNYNEKYLPALTELVDDNDRNQGENRQLLGDGKDGVKIEHNIRSLERARLAIDKYRVMLTGKRDAVSRMLESATREVKVARATLQTLQHVMSVGEVVLRALEEFNALSELSATDLLPLDDEELYNDYLDISRSLAVKLEG